MSNLRDLPSLPISFYTTAQYPCSYLPTQEARSLVASPIHAIDNALYSQLVARGFRRSGSFIYRPQCDHCQACIPVRVRVSDLLASKTQKKILHRHQNLIAKIVSNTFSEAHFSLYQRYLAARHPGAGMDGDTRERFEQFLLRSNVDTAIIEFREAGALRMVSVIDVLADGLSAVYTYFDPDMPEASYGTYGVLWQIYRAAQLEMPYVYLGYWIEESRKMRYKTNFKPAEGFVDGNWQEFDLTDPQR